MATSEDIDKIIDSINNLEINDYSHIISSKLQTKDWRKKQDWWKGGKHNECELYQIKILESILKVGWEKTSERLNTETVEIVEKSSPFKNIDGFEWTENFDGKIKDKDNIFYFNLKFVCDKGGAQTRSLREVYHYIKYQLEHLLKYEKTDVYFVNILDGDTSHRELEKFHYLINKEKYEKIKKYIFCNDLSSFIKWWNTF
jgi:hypothetical protein